MIAIDLPLPPKCRSPLRASPTADHGARPVTRTDVRHHALGYPLYLNNGPEVILHCNLTPRTSSSERVAVTASHPHTELKSP